MSDKYSPTPVGFARANKEPLDKYEIFSSITDLLTYYKTGPWYDGQICSVANTNNTSYKLTIGGIIPIYPSVIEDLVIKVSELDKYCNGAMSKVTGQGISSSTNILLLYHNNVSRTFVGNISFNGVDLSTIYNSDLFLNKSSNKCKIIYLYYIDNQPGIAVAEYASPCASAVSTKISSDSATYNFIYAFAVIDNTYYGGGQ